DGQSLLLAATNPAVVTYDASFAFELAVIAEDAIAKMLGDPGDDVIYYLTMYNEPVTQPPMPDGLDEELVLAGLYRYAEGDRDKSHRAQILASGSAMTMALQAQRLLAEEWDVGADVWSAPGWVQLHRDGLDCDSYNRLHPTEDQRTPYVTSALDGADGPVVAVSDFQKAVPGLIAPWVPGRFAVLGTDGFGHSDTRAALRRHFRIDAESIVVAVLAELAVAGDIKRETVAEAIQRYDIDPDATTDLP
ncbi:MAG: pyruvate dehydrogenase (acetyl-transferring), homodimeric type, partial [Nocardioidaceae bacterium]|nr:pyruvate dehydrogenase (acetyl-transferring), homodimeric type [Nocardioidaceae bacterium]